MNSAAFSYGNYQELCRLILETGRLCDYQDVMDRKLQEFILLRHDVEFSPLRAYRLGKLEQSMGVTSSYFFQVTNNAYNILSARNLAYIHDLIQMGHHIGLHFHLNGMTDCELIEKEIESQVKLLSHALGQPIDRFSFHRPTAQVLRKPLVVRGVINTYAPEFFTYFEEGNQPSQLAVKYVADSKNAWQYLAPYQYPNRQFFQEFKRIQILCHPYSWTVEGYDTLDNLKSLIAEKRTEFIETLDAETKYVKEYLHEL